MVTNTTDHAGARSGTDTMNALKSGVAGIHGVGETIRGNFNQAVDTAFNDKAGQAKNQQVANQGLNEINDGQYRGHHETSGAGMGIGATNTGMGPATTTTTTTGTGTTGTMSGGGLGGSSNHGPHGSNLLNKLDPRVDSDMGM
ncbi:MAG: hypothetical protein Q9187_007612 [Circinaria calcarea]